MLGNTAKKGVRIRRGGKSMFQGCSVSKQTRNILFQLSLTLQNIAAWLKIREKKEGELHGFIFPPAPLLWLCCSLSVIFSSSLPTASRRNSNGEWIRKEERVLGHLQQPCQGRRSQASSPSVLEGSYCHNKNR